MFRGLIQRLDKPTVTTLTLFERENNYAGEGEQNLLEQ